MGHFLVSTAFEEDKKGLFNLRNKQLRSAPSAPEELMSMERLSVHISRFQSVCVCVCAGICICVSLCVYMCMHVCVCVCVLIRRANARECTSGIRIVRIFENISACVCALRMVCVL